MAQLDPESRERLGAKYAKALAILRAQLPISPQAEAFVGVASNDVDRDTFTVEWWSTVKSDPAHADKTLTVRHRADVITGIRWPNQKPDINGEIRPPAIGEWTHFPYIISGNGVEWVRLHTVYGTVMHQHYVDGEPVSRDAWNAFRPASLANRPEHIPGNTLTVRMDKIRIV